jgi:hypothetical protein
MTLPRRALLMYWLWASLVTAVPALGYDYQVELAQHALTSLGYAPGAVDGRVARRTSKAILSFQRDHGLPPTGELDKATLAMLMELAGKRLDPGKLTLKGVVAFVSAKTRKCHQDNSAAILPNRMTRTLEVELRGAEVWLNTRARITPYPAASEELRAVNYRRRYRILPELTNLAELRIEQGGEALLPACYAVNITCQPDADCIWVGGVARGRSMQAVFDGAPDDLAALREAWLQLFRALGAREAVEPVLSRPPQDPAGVEPGEAQQREESE